MSTQDLIGTWYLESLTVEDNTGNIVHEFGEEPIGMLLYNPDGVMATIIMRKDRTQFADNPFRPTPQEATEAFASFEGYCGTYSVDAAAGTVNHHVEAARLPGYIGQDLVRHFKLAGDALHLHTAPIPYQDIEFVVKAVWNRKRPSWNRMGATL